MRTTQLLPFILSVALLVACGAPAPVDNRAADLAALQKTDEQWSATAAKNDLTGTLAFYSDDAVVLPPNAPLATDPKSIRQIWAEMLAPNAAVSWKVSKGEVAKSGEIGYVYGTYEMTVRNPKGGPDVRDNGKFLEIWRKQAGGTWKCIVDTYNSDLAAPAAPTVQK